MTTDPRGIITDVNKQTEALTGCTRDELIGAPFKNYFTDPGRAEAGINRVLSEGKVTNYELTARARDGSLTIVSYNATTFHDRDRRLQGVFAAARDMTERKRFEQTLQQKNVELEEASRMKSEFLANMSHELRTPLNAIIGFSEVLRDGLIGEMTDQQRGFIGDIFSSGKHLLALINDILDLSKVEAGKMLLDLESVHVSSLMANSLAIVRDKAAGRHVRLALDVGEELGQIQADARKVKQILYNLLSNAVKFTNEGGQVTLRARRVVRAEVDRMSGADGPELPAGRQPVRALHRDRRDRHGHRHFPGWAGAAVQTLQSDRQRPGPQVRRHGPGLGHGQASRGAARRGGGRGKRPERGRLLHGLAADPGAARTSRRLRPRHRPLPVSRCGRDRAPRWSWRTTSSRPI